MPKARILIVDDSAVMRRLLRDVISEDASLVVEAAPNGRLALKQIAEARPDLVVLDIEMPEMDGLETLVEVRKLHRRLPVVMFSSLTARGAAATIDSLTRGATDYVTKPSNGNGPQGAAESIRQQLLPKIKALCPAVLEPFARQDWFASAAPLPRVARSTLRFPVRIVAFGSSTGGPNALAKVISALPSDLPVPVVITQHMPPMFTRFLAERLNASCGLRVAEAAGNESLEAGQVWIAPGDNHMIVKQQGDKVVLGLNQDSPENSCRPSVDTLFRSVAHVYGSSALGVVLTGMGQDGLSGCSALVDKGSRVVVQDEGSSVVWGMPGFVARAGLAESVLPLDEIASTVLSIVQTSRLQRTEFPRMPS